MLHLINLTPYRSRQGQAIVEFALIAPILILLIMGVFDLGLAFFTNITLQNAAREGARYATLHVIATEEQAKYLMGRVNSELIAGRVHGSGVSLVCPNYPESPYTCQTADGATIVTYQCGAYQNSTLQCQTGASVSVGISRQYYSIFDFVLPGSFNLQADATFRMP